MKTSGEKANHFVGIGGSGMSALAQFHAMGGERVTGSDRLLDKGDIDPQRGKFEALGIELFPQDGSGVTDKTGKITVSTAIEETVPDYAEAKKRRLPIVHRTDALAKHVKVHKTIAVAGTSGKSTVTAMVYEILSHAGKSPSLITGAALKSLTEQGLMGNAFRGKSDLLVIEADESDGTLPKYEPAIGVLLNLSKDHKEMSETRKLFERFQAQSKRLIVNADAEHLKEFHEGSITFGFDDGQMRAEDLECGPRSTAFTLQGLKFIIPLPGRYNAENALAAAIACMTAGVRLEDCAGALAHYKGIAQRFEVVGETDGVEVINDYAHNPDKIRSVISAARLRAKRLLIVYQPHGFTPTKFLKDEIIQAFYASLRQGDALFMPDIYYVGGTTVKDIGSGDITGPIAEMGYDARHIPKREDILPELARAARPGDVVLVFGARDPTLPDFARRVLEAVREKARCA